MHGSPPGRRRIFLEGAPPNIHRGPGQGVLSMLLRLKIVGVHSVVPAPGPPGGGHDHGAACATAPRRSPAAGAARRRRRSVAVAMALKEEPESGRSGFAGGGPSWDPGLEIQVPFEQRPVTVSFSREQ